MSKETAHSLQPLLDRPDRKLLLAGRGGSLGDAIGRTVLDISGLERPKNVLIIPSAANNPDAYLEYVSNATEVFRRLGANVHVLHGDPTAVNFKDPSKEQIDNMVGEADVLWMSGGNTQDAQKLFNRTGLGKAIVDSRDNVISGGSFGGIIPARQSFSWSTPEGRPDLNDWKTVHGLNIVNAIVGVHNDYIENEPWRGGVIDKPRSHYFEPYLVKQLARPASQTPDLGIGIDDRSAIAIADGAFRVINAEDAEPNDGVTTYRLRDSGLIEARFTPANTQHYVPLDHLRPAA